MSDKSQNKLVIFANKVSQNIRRQGPGSRHNVLSVDRLHFQKQSEQKHQHNSLQLHETDIP